MIHFKAECSNQELRLTRYPPVYPTNSSSNCMMRRQPDNVSHNTSRSSEAFLRNYAWSAAECRITQTPAHWLSATARLFNFIYRVSLCRTVSSASDFVMTTAEKSLDIF